MFFLSILEDGTTVYETTFVGLFVASLLVFADIVCFSVGDGGGIYLFVASGVLNILGALVGLFVEMSGWIVVVKIFSWTLSVISSILKSSSGLLVVEKEYVSGVVWISFSIATALSIATYNSVVDGCENFVVDDKGNCVVDDGLSSVVDWGGSCVVGGAGRSVVDGEGRL